MIHARENIQFLFIFLKPCFRVYQIVLGLMISSLFLIADDLAVVHGDYSLTHGIDDVLIGIESGDDDVLKAVNKGYTAEDVIRECQKIGQAGLPFRIIYLGGLAGAGRLEESARKSAAVFNQIHPYYMYLTNVAVLPGTKLYGQMMRGEFAEATEKERLQEIRTLLAEMRNPIVVDTESAASSIYLKVKLPEEKASVLRELDAFIARFTPEQEKLLHARRARMLSV